MAEPKPLASLTSGLLARKGAAQPAMRRPAIVLGDMSTVQQDDLGWNDMGFDVAPVHQDAGDQPGLIGLTPMAPIVPLPQVMVEREVLAKRLARIGRAIDGAGEGRKAAFTLRLDADRHLKLRLACAITGHSAQQIVVQALDDLIDDLPEIDRLTQQLPHMRDGQ